MYRHQGIQALPVEVLALSFDYLSICELVTASHVSRFWRTVAWRHRSFWRNVKLAALSTPALELFHARLEAGSGITVSVDISIDDADFPEHLRSVVFLAISRNLHRIDKLHLRLDISCDVDIFRALNRPAPRLETLDIILCDDTRSSDRLPANLFACHAPKLRHVCLLNIQLLANRLPLAFWGVSNFRYCFNQAQSFPTVLFQHCKQLQSLTIYGRHCTVSRDRLAADAVEDWKLKAVEVSVNSGSFELMRHIPCTTIAHLTVGINDEPSAPVVLAHLRGRLELRLHPTPHSLYVQYTSRDTGMQRAFVCALEQVELACLPPALIARDILSRIDSISCTSSSAPLLSAYDEMQSCTRLTVSVAEDEPLRPLTRALSLPALECVEISSAVASRMRPADILSFLNSAMLPVSRAVRIDLVGIELEGDASELGERFVIPNYNADATSKDVPVSRTHSLLPPVTI